MWNYRCDHFQLIHDKEVNGEPQKGCFTLESTVHTVYRSALFYNPPLTSAKVTFALEFLDKEMHFLPTC